MNNEPRRILDSRTLDGLNRFMTQVYLIMASALAVSALTAYGILAYAPQVAYAFAQSTALMWGSLIVSLLLVFLIPRGKGMGGLALVMLYAYAAIEGVTLSIVALAYTQSTVAMAFLAAAVTFVSMAVVGTRTKKNLTGLGGHLMGALLALIIVSVINLFLQSAMVQYVFAYIGVVIFAGLTMYDVNTLRRLY